MIDGDSLKRRIIRKGQRRDKKRWLYNPGCINTNTLWKSGQTMGGEILLRFNGVQKEPQEQDL